MPFKLESPLQIFGVRFFIREPNARLGAQQNLQCALEVCLSLAVPRLAGRRQADVFDAAAMRANRFAVPQDFLEPASASIFVREHPVEFGDPESLGDPFLARFSRSDWPAAYYYVNKIN